MTHPASPTGRLPAGVLAAARDREHGASEVARQAIAGLLAVAGDQALLEEGARLLASGQPAMAPVWHVVRAARAPDPAAALTALGRRLDEEAAQAAVTAAAWVRERGGQARTVSVSSLVRATLERLGPAALAPGAPAGLVGADAISPQYLVNAEGTRDLAGTVPTLVVATSLALVPQAVADRLGGPGFERVPLEALAAVALGPDLLTPAEAGRRAAALPA